MSPASKAKSKDKKAGKDPHKNSLKTPVLANVASGTPVSGYNPLLGKFHTIEAAPLSSASSLQVNGRFRSIDESDDFSGSSGGNGMECDTLSNNGSWSGESEDPKDKTNSLHREAIPGVDSDKRDKIRQKNERKHQRQKERRALELYERCNGFLMSRKLEALAQQLVVMGFSLERATMALILNEGKIEQSVAWLLEGGEEAAVENCNLDGGNLKIDISDELARIADMEIRYKCSRQDVERAIVTCEGDLEKAADTLRVQTLHPPSTLQKPDETGDPPILTNVKLSLSNSNNLSGMQPKIMPSTLQQQKKDKVFNHTKTVATTNGIVAVEPGRKNLHVLKKPQCKAELMKPQQAVSHADSKWSAAVTNPPVSISLSPSSSLQATPPLAKTEARYTTLGSELKNLQLGSVKEPVKVMQRPQSANLKQVSSSSISSSITNTAAPSGGWYQNNVELVKPNGFSSNQMYSQLQHQHQQPQYVSNNDMMGFQGISRGNGLWSRTGSGSSPTLAVASSLGLFTGLGSNGSSGGSLLSPVDWKTGGSNGELDYANIDWSLDRSSRPTSGAWMSNNVRGYDAYSSGVGARTPLMPSAMANGGGGGGAVHASFRDEGEVVASSSETSTGGGRQWPFEEKDVFSLPWKYVTHP